MGNFHPKRPSHTYDLCQKDLLSYEFFFYFYLNNLELNSLCGKTLSFCEIVSKL